MNAQRPFVFVYAGVIGRAGALSTILFRECLRRIHWWLSSTGLVGTSAGADRARDAFARTKLPLTLRLAIGGLIVGALSTGVPEVWGNGYSVVNCFLHEPLAVADHCAGAGSHAPPMSILTIFEMTLSYQVVPPLMPACITGYVTARAAGAPSVYARALARNRQAAEDEDWHLLPPPDATQK